MKKIKKYILLLSILVVSIFVFTGCVNADDLADRKYIGTYEGDMYFGDGGYVIDSWNQHYTKIVLKEGGDAVVYSEDMADGEKITGDFRWFTAPYYGNYSISEAVYISRKNLLNISQGATWDLICDYDKNTKTLKVVNYRNGGSFKKVSGSSGSFGVVGVVIIVIVVVVGLSGLVLGILFIIGSSAKGNTQKGNSQKENVNRNTQSSTAQNEAKRDAPETVIIACPACQQKQRFPKGKGHLLATCPRCRYQFDINT